MKPNYTMLIADLLEYLFKNEYDIPIENLKYKIDYITYIDDIRTYDSGFNYIHLRLNNKIGNIWITKI
jgi:hypothetical protein